MENHTAKHFVLQLGSLITLYLSIGFLLVLLFNVINLIYPDAIENYWQAESYSSGVRLGIAMLIVFFPTYLVLTRKVNQLRRQEVEQVNQSGKYLGFTKWLIYLSLLIGGGVLLGDLVAIILNFLNGELTTRFMLKAGLLFVVVGSAFYYYLLDAKGYWLKEEKKSIVFGVIMSVFVLVSIITGSFHIETPATVREMKIDEKQIMDLQNIQNRIENHLRSVGSLPATIDELYVVVANMPTSSEDRENYVYEITENGFRLCAEFAHSSRANAVVDRYSYPVYVDDMMLIKNAGAWEYEVGWYCFDRVVSDKGDLNFPEDAIIKPAV